MLRRSPETILVAHKMDPDRREIYVEGGRDCAFLNWLADDGRSVSARVIPIDLVDVPEVEEGGNRERLRLFLVEVLPAGYEIRGLIDADQAALIDEAIPANAWITDLRDAEGYVLGEENVDMALRLGCGIEGVSASALLKSTSGVALFLAATRLVSHRDHLRLPVSRSRYKGYIRATTGGLLTLNRKSYLGALLQSAGISLSERDNIDQKVSQTMDEIAAVPIENIRHGKDCTRLLTLQFRALGAEDVTDVAPLLWSSFRKESLSQFPVLREILEFMRGDPQAAKHSGH
jgi:hypothetical protein